MTETQDVLPKLPENNWNSPPFSKPYLFPDDLVLIQPKRAVVNKVVFNCWAGKKKNPHLPGTSANTDMWLILTLKVDLWIVDTTSSARSLKAISLIELLARHLVTGSGTRASCNAELFPQNTSSFLAPQIRPHHWLPQLIHTRLVGSGVLRAAPHTASRWGWCLSLHLIT